MTSPAIRRSALPSSASEHELHRLRRADPARLRTDHSPARNIFLSPNWWVIAKFYGNFASGYQTYAGTGTLAVYVMKETSADKRSAMSISVAVPNDASGP
jgi:hypothetical protein